MLPLSSTGAPALKATADLGDEHAGLRLQLRTLGSSQGRTNSSCRPQGWQRSIRSSVFIRRQEGGDRAIPSVAVGRDESHEPTLLLTRHEGSMCDI